VHRLFDAFFVLDVHLQHRVGVIDLEHQHHGIRHDPSCQQSSGGAASQL
jgi:hypothetical protein